MKLINNMFFFVFMVDMVDYGFVLLIFGDVDNDGLNELLWGIGIIYFGEDLFVIVDVIVMLVIVKVIVMIEQFDSFNVVGWVDLYLGDE